MTGPSAKALDEARAEARASHDAEGRFLSRGADRTSRCDGAERPPETPGPFAQSLGWLGAECQAKAGVLARLERIERARRDHHPSPARLVGHFLRVVSGRQGQPEVQP